ncbi:hypothetical protein E2C01_080438 [Portunus trituberculatus]|uniref:Uncharacterized protein n=1 Tax=Portunus trituberculatus TaxID=210409 RepID=A0A5B7IVF2_PORTR|nr:hypothetical protein [Portunus trituberculatus]
MEPAGSDVGNAPPCQDLKILSCSSVLLKNYGLFTE